MRSNDPRSITPVIPQRDSARLVQGSQSSSSQEAAAINMLRSRIDTIYEGGTQATPQQPEPAAAEVQHAEPERTANQYGDWEKYHSAWQNYYQQYYQRYYVGQVHAARQKLESDAATKADQAVMDAKARGMTEQEAMEDLRGELRKKLDSHAKRVRSSKHFWPLMSGVLVMLVFLFLQYNAIIIANITAFVSPGNINPANIIVDSTNDAVVGPEPKLIVPKINVEVPIEFNTTTEHDNQMKAMENGVAWFGVLGTSAAAHPGEVGNTVLSGHSSNDFIEAGSYKFIFARLEQMKEGDTIIVNYASKRYTYTVTRTEVVKPTQVSKLYEPAVTKPMLTLITCVPLGTSQNRLLVWAEQVSPDPAGASQSAAASEPRAPVQSQDMPGATGSLFDRLFNGGN